MTKILFLSASPVDQDRLEVVKEYEKIEVVTRNANYGNEIKIEQAHEVSLQKLQNLLLKFRPRIVHFSGHGSKKGKLGFQNYSTNKAETAPIEAIGNLFKIANKERNIRCVVLNACHSKEQAKEISKYVDCVIGTSGAISDDQAFAFDEGFYNALANAKSIESAVAFGINALERKELSSDIIEQQIRKGVDPSKVYLVDDTELFEKAQDYGLSLITLNYFEKKIDIEDEFKKWKEGLLSFSLRSIKKGLEYRRKIIDTDEAGSNSIKTRLEKNGCIVLDGDSGYSKTTLLMELICDYFDKDYKVLSNIETPGPIKKERKLLDFLEDILSKGHKLLVAVDNVHDEKTAGIFYVIQQMRDHGDINLKKNILFVITSRVPDVDWFIENKQETLDELVQNAIRKILDYRYDIPAFEEDEIKDLLIRYSDNKDDFNDLDARTRTIHAETKGHPILVKFFIFGKGLAEDVKSRFDRYLKQKEEHASLESDVMKTMLVCALLDISAHPITDKLLKELGIEKHAWKLYQRTLYRFSEFSWKTIHPKWCMELFSFLYNRQITLPIVEKRKVYLQESLKLLYTLKDDYIVYDVIVTTYNLGLKEVPIEIIECTSFIPEYVSKETKCDLYLSISGTYRRLAMYEKAIDKCYECIRLKPKYIPAWNNKGNALYDLSKHEDAIKCYDKAIEIDANYFYTWNNKGNALHNLCKYQDAIKCYDKAIEIKPDYTDAGYNRACSKVKDNDTENGLAHLKNAIEIDKKFIELAKQDKHFDRIRNEERFKEALIINGKI